MLKNMICTYTLYRILSCLLVRAVNSAMPICFIFISSHSHRYLYWTEGGDTPRVARASLDNFSSIQTIYSSQLNEPTGITIDYLTTTLIWASNLTVYSSNLDGTNVQELVSTNTDQSPFQILVTGDRLYWTSSAIAGLNVMTLGDTESLTFLSFQGTSPVSSWGITAIDENKRPESGEMGAWHIWAWRIYIGCGIQYGEAAAPICGGMAYYIAPVLVGKFWQLKIYYIECVITSNE